MVRFFGDSAKYVYVLRLYFQLSETYYKDCKINTRTHTKHNKSLHRCINPFPSGAGFRFEGHQLDTLLTNGQLQHTSMYLCRSTDRQRLLSVELWELLPIPQNWTNRTMLYCFIFVLDLNVNVVLIFIYYNIFKWLSLSSFGWTK